ncbi:MAG: hypothetical protein H6513_07870 [Acidimicrobiaceae bacterium]|nr:hypothetical protein [Actinomycetota bacterium]MCB0980762.1 hypothetical protein [Ilumatobacter sp.]MCB9380597.1 hypothetical protein [Acidimicrobiaceae bacterium]
MTIAIALKVRDGIVLAADSATTLSSGTSIHNVYNHANKIVNLQKGRPIGLMTWGIGGFANASIATLAKDFRADVWPSRFETGYTVKDVAEAVRSHFVDVGADGELKARPEGERAFGFLVAGHTPHQTLGEAWVVETDQQTGDWSDPLEVLSGDQGLVWYGVPQWIQRLVVGIDIGAVALALVERFGIPPTELGAAIEVFRSYSERSFIHPAMPIQDVIDLASYLAEVTKGAVAFTPGAPTVGGQTELAAITKHEGFKWVSRKHYFSQDMNPETMRWG